MAQIGAIPLPLKDPERGFRGITTLSQTSPFHFLEIENGYVNSDASEIRTFPGYVCTHDFASTLRSWSLTQQNGYICNHFAARRGSIAQVGAYKYDLVPSANQTVWTRPTQLHCIEQVGQRWIVVGQSDHLREPILNSGATAYVKVISYAEVGGFPELTLDANPLTTADTFNTVQAGAGTTGSRVYLEGLTGALASVLNGRSHYVTNIAGAVVRLATAVGGGSATGQNGYIDRVSNPGSASGVLPATDDQESLTIWTSIDGGDPALTAATRPFPAHVFNRQRDFGDTITAPSTGNLKQGNSNAATISGGRSRRRQKTLPYRLVPHVAGNRLILVAPGYGCVFQAPVKIPPNFDELSFQFGAHALCNDIYDQPRCLGVPKAVQWSDPDKTVAPSGNTAHIEYASTEPFAFGGSSGATGNSGVAVTARAGTYKFKVAYKDEVTGEVGLCSEEVAITTDAATVAFEGLRIFVYFPGYLMHECGALSINLYRTIKDGDTFFFDQSFLVQYLAEAGPFVSGFGTIKYGLPPTSATTEYFHHVVLRPIYTTDTQLQENEGLVPETIEQMPMGAKCGRTMRGFTLFGGALGNAGTRQELQRGTLTMFYDKNVNGLNAIERFRNHIGSTFTNDFDTTTPPLAPASFQGVEEGFGCAARNIPPAYAGQIISGKWFPYPRRWIQLDRLVNTTVGYDGTFPNDLGSRIQDVRYTILDTPLLEFDDLTSGNAQLQQTHLLLPRAQVQISEPDNPGVTPATNTTVLASMRDDDVEAIGDANGQAIVCTRSATYSIAFSDSPVGTPPDLANSGFGCIAANSMISFESGAAWISERGPVAWSGGVQFIGESLESRFTPETGRYLRDSTGMMRHAWGCHDHERKLLYFGLYAGRAGIDRNVDPGALTVQYQGTTYDWTSALAALEGGVSIADRVKSLFPADEVLIYSYRTGAWSVWRPPLTLGIQWMTRGIDAQGQARIFFLGSDKRQYALGDEYGQGDRESYRRTTSGTGTLSVIPLSASVPGTGMSWVGLTVAIYSEDASSGLATLKGTSTVTVATPGASEITLATAITVAPNDVVIIGARTMRIDTSFQNLKQTATARAAKLGVRYRLWSRHGQGLGSTKQQAFVAASVKTEIKRDEVPTSVENSLTANAVDPTAYKWLVQDQPNAPVHERGLSLGAASGANHQVRLTFLGGAQVRLQDLYVEAQ